MFGVLGRAGALLAMSLLLTGCFLRTLFGGVGAFPEDELIVTLRAGASLADCVQRPVEETPGQDSRTTVECTYWLADEDEFLADVVSTAELVSEFGWFGVLVDPLILQVPDDATDIAATYTRTGGAGALQVTVTESFPVDAATTVQAEPGHRFVILELPADEAASLPDGDARSGLQFAFDLQFRVATQRAIEVKAMYALRIEAGGQVFYAPMAPCVTDFATVPAITVPVTPGGQNLAGEAAAAARAAAAAGVEGCQGRRYDLRPSTPPPHATRVAIDVSPGSEVNPINVRRPGVVAVAVLTTSVHDGDGRAFDATTIDPGTARFGPGAAVEAHGRGHIEDVDHDGDDDLVLHFQVLDTGLGCGDGTATLTATTFQGARVEGSDVIRPRGCGGAGAATN